MKIVYCTDDLWQSGGTERVLTTKVNWLAEQPNTAVWIITLTEKKHPFFQLNPKVKRIMLPVSLGNKATYIRELTNVLNKIKPDVSIAVSGMAVDILWQIQDGSKKILEFHYTKNYLVNFVNGIQNLRFRPLHILKMKWLQWKLAQTAKKYDLFVGLTKKDIGLWGNPKNMTYVHNPLSFRSEKKSNCESKTIISVGSWTPAKGMDQLLEAFGMIAHKYPEWRVELYGNGQDEERLKGIIAKYGMECQVSMNAPCSNIAEKLVSASIYAFPSRSDGFGLVITEAMECGLPTVAMDCPCGPCEIVSPNTGIVVPEQDIKAFSRALEQLITDTNLRKEMGRYASKEVERFYPNNVMPKWVELFNQ